MKSPNIQIKEIPNKIFLSELQNRLRENEIKDKELALNELTFTANEQELPTAYNDKFGYTDAYGVLER